MHASLFPRASSLHLPPQPAWLRSLWDEIAALPPPSPISGAHRQCECHARQPDARLSLVRHQRILHWLIGSLPIPALIGLVLWRYATHTLDKTSLETTLSIGYGGGWLCWAICGSIGDRWGRCPGAGGPVQPRHHGTGLPLHVYHERLVSRDVRAAWHPDAWTSGPADANAHWSRRSRSRLRGRVRHERGRWTSW